MAKCEVCQQVNVEHQKPTWFLQSYMNEVVRLHEVLVSIVLDQDPRFTFWLWANVQQALGTKLNLSTAYHPQTDGQFEKTIQVLEDLLRACISKFGGN